MVTQQCIQIGNRVRDALDGSKMTIKELLEKTGEDRRYFNRICHGELGSVGRFLQFLEKFCYALDIEKEFILFGHDCFEERVKRFVENKE